jgi:hypothetical protein
MRGKIKIMFKTESNRANKPEKKADFSISFLFAYNVDA